MARILVIDDDQDVRLLAREALESAGHEVIVAADGAQGLELQRKSRAAVVITDILMPEKEGLETIRGLRRLDPEVRIIAISGADPESVNGYLRLAVTFGARRILGKPFGVDDLLAAVSEVLAS